MPRRRRERSFSGETSDSSSRSQIFQKDRLSSFASDDGTTSDSSYSAGTGANLVDSDLVEQSLFANDEFEQFVIFGFALYVWRACAFGPIAHNP